MVNLWVIQLLFLYKADRRMVCIYLAPLAAGRIGFFSISPKSSELRTCPESLNCISLTASMYLTCVIFLPLASWSFPFQRLFPHHIFRCVISGGGHLWGQGLLHARLSSHSTERELSMWNDASTLHPYCMPVLSAALQSIWRPLHSSL